MTLLDTSAWIEFFKASDSGEKVRNYIKTDKCYTSLVTIAEISNWAIKHNFDAIKLLNYIMTFSQIINLNIRITFLAGELNFRRKTIEKNWGMIDSIILATAQNYNMKILTKDSHFKDLPNVEIL